MKNVVLANVRNGSLAQDRQHIIYAEVRDAADGSLLVGATLDYIVGIAAERGYNFVAQGK